VIIGIGTDLIHISRIDAALSKSGRRFAERILHPDEMQAFDNKNTEKQRIAFLAKRFAAKEALSKALKTGIGKVSWHSMLVQNDAKGAPNVVFFDEALRLYNVAGATSIHLSLSDERDLALAFAVISA